MDKATLEALLGRTLTTTEDANLELYLNIASESLDNLLCLNLLDDSTVRVFDARDGYSTVFMDIFTEVQTVKLNGNTTTDYSVRQWSKRNATWYNSIVFEHKLCDDDEVEVTATWGFETMPNDLQMLLAQLFSLISKKNKFDNTVESKQVEDFRISLNTDADLDEEFYSQYGSTISKYSLCLIPYFKQGKTGRC